MTDMFRLDGKTALVTGASGGLGAHFASVLAAAGAKVIVAARRTEALAKLTSQIEADGGQCHSVELDVTSPQSISRLGPMLDEVDILVNNAGIAREGAFLEQSLEDWDSVMDTNLKGMFLMMQEAGRAMKARGAGGTIINIASVLGLRQGGGVGPYAASKAGVIQLTKSAALELARYGIRVNAIAPGYIETAINAHFFETEAGQQMLKRIPQRRLGLAGDLDGPLLLLASDAGSYMTGTVIVVDGGHLVSSL